MTVVGRRFHRAIMFVLTIAWIVLGLARAHAEETIDPRSGQLLVTITDLAVPAGPLSLKLERSLNAVGEKDQRLLGARWRLNWESRLFQHGEQVLIEEGIGSIVFTQVAGKSGYTSRSGERLATAIDGRMVRTRLDATKDTFDSQGRLVERDLQNGNKLTLRYGTDGRLSRIEGPGRSFVEFSADKTGKVLRVQASSGDIVRYGYIGEDLSEVQVNNGPALKYAYDATGALVRIDDPRLGVVQLGYDAKGRVLSRRWADGSQQRYEYDDAANSVRIVDPAGGINTMTWSRDNRRVEITSPLGHKSVIEYDAAGRVAAATGPTGAVVRNRYDALGRRVVVEAPNGQQSRFEYEGDTSRLKTIIQPDGSRRVFEYDAQGNLTTVKVGSEVVTALTYHPDGSVASVQGSGQPVRQFAYHPDGRLKTVANALGETSQLEYDSRGNLIRETNPLGGVTLRSYDPNDRLASLTDPDGRTMRYAPDAAGRLNEIIDAAGAATRYQYDARGRVVAETHRSGQTSRYEYDPAGRLAKVIRPGGGVESIRYDAAGNATESVDGLGRSTAFEYDALGRVVRERRPSGLEIRYRYDSLGNLVGIEDSTGGKTEFQRDSFGRLTAFTDAAGVTSRYRYDALGNVVASIDARNQSKSFTYTASGSVASAREPSGDAARYEYDAAGRLAAVHHPSGGVTRLGYDAMGNLVRVTDPLGSQRVYTYDVAGRRTSATDAAGQTTRYVFNPYGRLAEKRFPDGKRIAYQYDALGNLVQVDDGVFPVRYAYDRLNRLSRVEYPAIKKWVEYEYDAQGLQTKLTDSERRETRYEYDVQKRLAAIVLPDGKRITFEYDVWNRQQSIGYPNGITGRWEYNAAGRIAKISYRDKSGNIVAGWDYRYDAAGNLIERQDGQGRSSRFQYDPAGQLTDETSPAGAIRYRYSAGGNRTAVEAGGSTTLYRHDAADRLLDAGAERLTYDANGNVIARQGPAGKAVYTYDAADRLVQVRAPDGTETAFGYAPTGERISKRDKNGLRYFLYSGSDLIQELGETGTTAVTYIHGPGIDRPLAMVRDGRYYFYHADRLGSVSLMSDDQGQTVAVYEYDAFGKLFTQAPSVPNPFMFTGREWDASTGLYYYRARYYDAGLGRFISPDPLPAKLGDPLPLNPYLYVRNNPLRFVDPLGLEETWPTGIGAGWENITSPDLGPTPRPGPIAPGGGTYDPYWDLQYWRAVAARGGPGAEEAATAAAGRLQDMIDADIPIEPRTGTKPTLKSNTLNTSARAPGSTLPPVSPNQPTLSGDGPPRAPIPEGQTIRMSPNQPRVPALRGGVSTGFIPAPPQVTVTGVAGGVGTAAGIAAIGIDYQACLDENKSPEACKQELTDKLPWMAGGALVGGALMFTPFAPLVAVGGAAAALWGLNNAGNRWANAEEVKALHAQLAGRLQAIEGKIAAFEKKAGGSSAAALGDAKARAAAFADAAASNLAALRGDLAQADGFCAVANGLRQEMNGLAGDADNRLTLLDTGLTAADGIVAACTSKDGVTRAKELYSQGIRMAAEMVLLAQRAEKAQGLLQEARATADRALASAEQRAQMIAGNAEVADAAAAQARALAQDDAAARSAGLAQEGSALHAEIDALRNWFAARPEVQAAAPVWKGRVSAVLARAQETGNYQADVNAAELAATRAASRRDEGRSLISEARGRVDGCAQSATAAIGNAVAATAAANVAAAGTLGRFSDLPAAADSCIAKLDAPPPRSLIALHVQCPAQAYVGDLVTCTATGVYNDDLNKAEDLTQGPWDVGPVFTSQTPGVVDVRITRLNMSDRATVTFEPRPATPPTSTTGIRCWSDRLQAYYQIPLGPCPPASTEPTYNPVGDPNLNRQPTRPPVVVGQPPGVVPTTPDGQTPTGTGGSPTGSGQNAPPIPGNYTGSTGGPQPGTASSGTGQQTISCWSDQLQALVPTLGYMCPSTNTQPGGRTPSWTDLPVSPSSPRSPGASKGGPPSKTGGKPPPSGGSCGPMTTCKCAGGKTGHIPCDKSMGACHCGGG